jgi:hypothetical protein
MNIHHAWCDLKPGVSDIAFSEGASKYLSHLHAKGLIESWRITRRKLGLGQPEIGEFHLMIEVKDLAQLDRAVDHVAERSEPTEGFHFGLNSLHDVRYWHKADIGLSFSNVCFWGQSGHRVEAL